MENESAIEASKRLTESIESLDIDEELIDRWNSLDNVSFTMKAGDGLDGIRVKGNSGEGLLKGKQMSKVLGKR